MTSVDDIVRGGYDSGGFGQRAYDAVAGTLDNTGPLSPAVRVHRVWGEVNWATRVNMPARDYHLFDRELGVA